MLCLFPQLLVATGCTGPVDLVVQLLSWRSRDLFVFQILGLDERPSSVFMQEFFPSISWEMHVFLNSEKNEYKKEKKEKF